MKSERDSQMTDNLALQWIERVKTGDEFYQTHIGKGLEGNSPIAQDFLKRAKRLNPDFITDYYPGFRKYNRSWDFFLRRFWKRLTHLLTEK